MVTDFDYYPAHDFLSDQCGAYIAPSAEEYQDANNQHFQQGTENNTDTMPPNSPAFWFSGLLESTDLQPYSGPSDGAWQSPAYLSTPCNPGGSPVSESSFGSLTPPSSLAIDVPSLPTPTEPWVDEWASLETTVSGEQASAPWMLPEPVFSFGSSTPPSSLGLGLHSLPIPPEPWVEEWASPETTVSGGQSSEPWMLEEPTEDSWAGIQEPVFEPPPDFLTRPTTEYAGYEFGYQQLPVPGPQYLQDPPFIFDGLAEDFAPAMNEADQHFSNADINRESATPAETAFTAEPPSAPWPLHDITAVDETWTSDLVALPPSMPIRATENDYGYSEPSVAHEYYIGSSSNQETSTTSSDPIYYEGIASQKFTSGMPAESCNFDTSGNVTGYDTRNVSQFQRDSITNERGRSREKGKGKRTADDSLGEILDESQAPKRARVCDQREPARMMGGEQQTATGSVSAGVALQRTTSNREPRQATPPLDEPEITPFRFVTGRTDSGGDAKMETNKTHEMLEIPPAEQDPQASLRPNDSIEEIFPERKIVMDEKNMAVECILIGRKMKGKLKLEARQEAGMYSTWALN